MIIYKTTNIVTGKFYIGQDTKNNPKYLGSGIIIKQAIKKYGKECFIKEILEYCDTQKQLNDREKYWINETNALELGYNLAEGGFGVSNMSDEIKQKISSSKKGKKMSEETKKIMSISFTGRKHSEESKKKISESNTGKKHSEEHKKKISESSIGKKHSEESKEKISESNTGKKHSEESKQKIGDASRGKKLTSEHKKILYSFCVGNQWNKGRKHTEETKSKISMSGLGKTHNESTKKLLSDVQKTKKKVCQIDPITNEIIKLFFSINEAAKDTKINRTNISTCLNNPNKRPIAGGFKWEFYKENDYV